MQLNETSLAAYRGEPVDIEAVLGQISLAAKKTGWQQDRVSVENKNLRSRVDAVAYRRLSRFPSHRIYLSSGIHGDEPAGPAAILELMEANRWPAELEVWVCPCLNPSGFLYNRRENARGIDLDRDYRSLETEEVQTHVFWLKRKPNFDLTLCLHEDHTAPGFFLYESNPDDLPSAAKKMISRVAGACLIDRSPLIHERPAANGIVRLADDPYRQMEWTEAIFLATHKTKLSYRLESPSQMPLEVRVTALVSAVRAAAEWVVGNAG